MSMTSSSRSPSRRTSVTIRNIRLTSLFKPEDILHHYTGDEPEEIIRKLLEHLALNYGIGNLQVAMDEVMTGIERDDIHACSGMAVLYARLEKVSDPLIAIATKEKGVEIGGKIVYLVIVVLIPMDMPGAFKQILHGLTKVCGTADNTPQMVAAFNSSLTVWQHFDAGAHHLPGHLQARHIMSKALVSLDSNDSLAKAIDLFLAHRMSELPVLTPDRELMGVVTTRRLVKVCLPDYLMWVEDMTPFLNFEPIAEIIRNESSTWLREIMDYDFAHVTEDAPAILALKEIGRHDTDNAYVLKGRRLVGVIQLHEFLSSVLR